MNLTTTTGELQIPSGWTTINAKWIKRTGKVVEFYVEIIGGSLISGWTTVATIPNGFQPNGAFDFTGVDNKTGGSIQTKVNSVASSIQVYAASAQTGANLRLHSLYIIA